MEKIKEGVIAIQDISYRKECYSVVEGANLKRASVQIADT